MWSLSKTDEFERRHKLYSKKKKLQLMAVLNNLEKLLTHLKTGRKPKPFVYGFLRSEPAGIIAIDEAGGGSNVAATRLYVYPDDATETLYLLTIGDKQSQHEDIQRCKAFVKEIQANPDCGDDHGGHDEDQNNAGDG